MSFVTVLPNLCSGCNKCTEACSRVHKKVGLQSHPRLSIIKEGTSAVPVLCHHCLLAPCVKVCPVNAIIQNKNSVTIDEVACIGCKLCTIVCPFGAITPSGTGIRGVANPTYPPKYDIPSAKKQDGFDPILDWEKGVRSVAVKCDLCDFQDSGPECVKACPTKALVMIHQDPSLLPSAEKWRKVPKKKHF